jgi:hypothetical protein
MDITAEKIVILIGVAVLGATDATDEMVGHLRHTDTGVSATRVSVAALTGGGLAKQALICFQGLLGADLAGRLITKGRVTSAQGQVGEVRPWPSCDPAGQAA